MDPVSYQPHGRIAVLTVNHPPVNTLSLDVRRGLMAAIERALHDNAVDAIIIIGGGATFVAGADINDFGKPYAPPSLYAIMDLIAADAKPVVAAIHGNALGGGMELALSCQWRIAAPGAMLGQPEVKLGLMPGGGGTQWWPRLAGPEIALNVCTGGARSMRCGRMPAASSTASPGANCWPMRSRSPTTSSAAEWLAAASSRRRTRYAASTRNSFPATAHATANSGAACWRHGRSSTASKRPAACPSPTATRSNARLSRSASTARRARP